MSEALLLELREARSSPDAPPLSLRSSGPRLVVLGDVSPVMDPLLGRSQIASGAFEVLGERLSPPLLARLGRAPLGLPLPLELTPHEYATWSARLAGASARDARRLSSQACAAAGLGGFAQRPIESLPLLLRRLTVLAQAAVSPLPLLVLESPLEGLDDESAAHLFAALGRLSLTRPLLVSVGSAAKGSAGERLVLGADEVLVLERGALVEQGPPAKLSRWRAETPAEEVAASASASEAVTRAAGEGPRG